jgi:hypothetical protein
MESKRKTEELSIFFRAGLWNVFKFTRLPDVNEVRRKRDDASFLKEIFPQSAFGVLTTNLPEATGATAYKLKTMRAIWYDLEHAKKPEDMLPLCPAYEVGVNRSGWFATYLPKDHPDLKESNAPTFEKLVSRLRKALGLPEISNEGGGTSE